MTKYPSRRLLARRFLVLIGAAALCAACESTKYGQPTKFVQPSVAIESFENRAPFPLKWELGSGMAQILSAELTTSNRVNVVSREALGSVLDELSLQKDPAFRDQGRSTPGRLRNADYLVQGTVVDFTHTAGGGLHVLRGLLHGRTEGYVALVTIAVSVIDIETRDVRTATFEGRAWASSIKVGTTYKGVGFGGSAFFKKPLGEATQKAISDAVEWVIAETASSAWAPLIARIEDDAIYVSGGRDRLMRVGERLSVVEDGQAIVDPATGDVLGVTGTETVAEVQVIEVEERFSVVEVISGGDLRVGQRCVRTPVEEE